MRRTKSRRHDDEGISSVIGAILVTGLVFALLLTIRLSFVPVWEKNAETAHMVTVEKQLAIIKAELDRQTDNRTANALTNGVTLTPDRVSIFQAAPPVHRMGFESGGGDVKFSSTLLRILINNGLTISGLSPDWNAFPGGAIDDIESVESLRVRFDLSKADIGDSILLQAFDVNGDKVGNITIEIDKQTSDIFVTASTNQEGEDDDNPIAAVTDSAHIATTTEFYFVDALDPTLLFDQLLASAEGPFSLELSETGGIGAEYVIAFNQATGSGTVLQGTTGVDRPDYNATYTAGSMVYEAASSRFDQTYFLENGALILSQSEGAAFRIPPSFSVLRTGGTTALSVTLPSLTGSGASISGVSNVKVTTTSTVATDIRAVAPDFRMRVNTTFPQLWADYFEEQLSDTGLSSPTQYEVTHDSVSATFTLYGTNVDAAAKDLSIRLKQARVAVTMEG